jgi:CO/xanthine dehydrogenase Mo-binding subunit
MGENGMVGAWVKRVYDPEKAAGTLKFTDDLSFGPELLHAKAVRSTIACGRIINVDHTEALKVPGVVKVILGKDRPIRCGIYLKDRVPMAVEKVRYLGEPVALVVAESEDAAEEGAHKTKIEYEEEEAVFDPVEAMKEGSPLVHPDLENYERVSFVTPEPGTNIAQHFKIRRGDIEKGFEEADHVLEEFFSCPQVAHAFLETHNCICHQDPVSKEITVWTAAQSAFTVREIIAKTLGLPLHKVRVITPPIGGGFGGKAGVTIEGLCLMAALDPDIKGRPVKLFVSREEVMLTSWVRQGWNTKVKMGVKKDGTITAMKVELIFDTGASAEYGVNPVRSAGYSSNGCYYVPNIWSDTYGVYTNKAFGGAYRGFGLPELLGGLEMVVDTIANRLNIDPVEFRLKNLIKPGLPMCTGTPIQPHALEAIIKKVAEKSGYYKNEPSIREGWKRGKGIALAIKAPAMPADASSSAVVEILGDGSVKLLAATMDMGQGAYTAYTQIVSEELGVPIDKVKCYYPDTAIHPYDWQTVASRSLWSMGMAIKRACEDAKEQLLALYAEYWKCKPEEITISNGIVRCERLRKEEPIDEKVQNGFNMPDGELKGGPIIGRGQFTPPDVIYPDPETGQSTKSVVHFTVGAVGVDLEADPSTGEVVINKIVGGYDVGKAISPLNVMCQIEGGTVQGVSQVLFEGMYYDDKGRLLNPDFTDYKIATTMDVPWKIESFWEETSEELSPYGNRGVGEHPMIAVGPAIGNALYKALGIRIHKQPFNRERVYMANKAAEKGEEDFWD